MQFWEGDIFLLDNQLVLGEEEGVGEGKFLKYH